MQAVTALLEDRPDGCLRLLESVKPGSGPSVNVEIEDDVVVTISPDLCGIAVLRAEALERLGRLDEALAQLTALVADCRVARIVADEIREQLANR